MIAGTTSASVTVSADESAEQSGRPGLSGEDDRTPIAGGPEVLKWRMSFPLSASDGASDPSVLDVYGSGSDAFDAEAEQIGFILASHAAPASRAVGDRVGLERLLLHLQETLESRDVIGQAKGILMDRRKIGPDEAFAILKRSSQRLNVKLREIAGALAATGDISELG